MLKLNYCIAIGLFLQLGTTTVRADNTKAVMQKALESTSELSFYAADPDRFRDVKNKTKIQEYLKNLLETFNSTKHNRKLHINQFAPALENLVDNIKTANTAFNNGHVNYAYHLTREMGGLCLNCHTQLPTDQRSSLSRDKFEKKREAFQSNWEYANYLMVVRNYNMAEQTLLGGIAQKVDQNNTPGNKREMPDMKDWEAGLDGLLTIYLKVKKSPEMAFEKLNPYLSQNIPASIKTQWEESVNRAKYWTNKKHKLIDPKNDQDIKKVLTQIEGIAKELNFADRNVVDLLYFSGVLSNYLYKNGKSSEAAGILYWLGLAHKYLARNDLLNLGDLYFKECIINFSKNAYAKKCLAEYEDSITFGFTGSAGTSIPEEILKELRELKEKIK
jgi:hypothetical protein